MRNVFILIALFASGTGWTQPGSLNLIEAQSYGGVGSDRVHKLEVLNSGSAVFGSFAETWSAGGLSFDALGSPDLFLAHLNADLSVQWQREFGRIAMQNGMNNGGLSYWPQEEQIFFSGAFQNTVNFGNASPLNVAATAGKDAFYGILDSETGETQQIFRAGGSGFDFSSDILKSDFNDRWLVALRLRDEAIIELPLDTLSYSAQGETDAMLIALDGEELAFTHQMNSSGLDDISALAIHEATGRIVMGGYHQSTAGSIPEYRLYLKALEANGETAWFIDFQQLAAGNSLAAISISGNYVYLTGTIQSPTDFDPGSAQTILEPQFTDVFTACYTIDGELVWARLVNSSGPLDAARDLTVNPQTGGVVVCGAFSGTANFGTPQIPVIRTASGNSDAFICEYSLAGDLVWLSAFAGNGNEEIASAVFTGQDTLQIAGNFDSNLFVEPDQAETDEITTQGSSDFFIGSFVVDPTNSLAEPLAQAVVVLPYPNPADAEVCFRLNLETESVEASLFDSSGRLVANEMHRGPNFCQTTSQLPPGTYFALLRAGEVYRKSVFSVVH